MSLPARLARCGTSVCSLFFLPWWVTLSPFSTSLLQAFFRKVGAGLCGVHGPAQRISPCHRVASRSWSSRQRLLSCWHRTLLTLWPGCFQPVLEGPGSGRGVGRRHLHKIQRPRPLRRQAPGRPFTRLVEFNSYPPERWVLPSLQDCGLLGSHLWPVAQAPEPGPFTSTLTSIQETGPSFT